VPRRPLRSGRLFTGGLLLGAAGAALAPAGPDALVPFKILAASAADDVYVAVIVDFGSNSGLSSISKCVPVPSGSTDSDALAAAVGQNNVAYSSSGLLCSIDGYPANGVQNCNATSGNGQYFFWSYWHGATGSWSYANDGPAEHGAADGDVEGWRFQNPGPASPGAPPPGPAPSYATICGVHVPSSTTTTTTMAANPGPTTPTTVAAASGSGSTTTTTAKKGPSSNTKGQGTPNSGGSSTTTATGIGFPKPSSTNPPGHATTSTPRQSLAASNAGSHPPKGSSGGAALPIIVVTLTALALGLMAVFLIRRRPAEE
jgi:hypothetical protein